MPASHPTILVTGASGHLGGLIIDGLLDRLPTSDVAAMVRNADAGTALRARGVQVRVANYDDPATLDAALVGIHTLMFVSADEIGRRAVQHQNVIDAARRAGVALIVYTSLLHADRSPLALATEHRATEAQLRDSGIPSVLLRNGWYTENHTGTARDAIARGTIAGSAGDGRIAPAARADYAAAAVAVLTAPEAHVGRVYELAGDDGYTMREYAAELARQSGRPVAYHDLPAADYEQILLQAGLPAALAHMLADSDVGAAGGALFDGGGQLRALIGRPTTPLADVVAAALR